MMPLWEAPEALFGGLSCEELEDRAALFAEDECLKARIADIFSKNRLEYPEPTHVEEMLYAGFSSASDTALCKRFHAAPWDERPKIGRSFEDNRLKELAQRISYFECRSSLPSEIVRKMDIDLANRLMSSDAKPPSVEHALKEVAEELTLSKNGPHAISLLEGYTAFLSERRSKIKTFLQTR